jgi:hypothetical protein
MTEDEFRASLALPAPPALSAPLRALWRDAKGDWDGAHEIVAASDEADAMWVHAYLHREDGDLGNAGYWYARAGRAPAQGLLAEEFAAMLAVLLGR